VTYEIFVTQRVRYGAPVCTLCGDRVMNGLICTCACEAMWLYRATQGKVRTTACHVRDLTDDCSGGTNLRQMQSVSAHYGVTKGALYQPARADSVLAMVASGSYGSHWSIGYAPVVGTGYDAFAGTFRGNHDLYLSGPGKTPGTTRTGDPGFTGYRDWPNNLLKLAASRLELRPGVTLAEEEGGGLVYGYVTPPDPARPTWWPDYAGVPPLAATFAVQFAPGRYPRLDQYGNRIGTFSTEHGFTAYGNSRWRHPAGHVIGKLITDRPGIWIDTTTASHYWSK
jgi:hypothetical protein